MLPLLTGEQRLQRKVYIEATAGLQHLLSTLQGRCCHRHMQDSLPAGWLAFAGRELNPLDRYERFPSCYISSPFPEFILTLGSPEHGGTLVVVGMTRPRGACCQDARNSRHILVSGGP